MAQDAKCGLPEVHLGLLPGAGGTQMLPRVCGAETAISLMTTGRPVGAVEALKIGLVDELSDQPGGGTAFNRATTDPGISR